MDLLKYHVPACKKSEYMLPSDGEIEKVEVRAKLLKFRMFFSYKAAGLRINRFLINCTYFYANCMMQQQAKMRVRPYSLPNKWSTNGLHLFPNFSFLRVILLLFSFFGL